MRARRRVDQSPLLLSRFFFLFVGRIREIVGGAEFEKSRSNSGRFGRFLSISIFVRVGRYFCRSRKKKAQLDRIESRAEGIRKRRRSFIVDRKIARTMISTRCN